MIIDNWGINYHSTGIVVQNYSSFICGSVKLVEISACLRMNEMAGNCVAGIVPKTPSFSVVFKWSCKAAVQDALEEIIGKLGEWIIFASSILFNTDLWLSSSTLFNLEAVPRTSASRYVRLFWFTYIKTRYTPDVMNRMPVSVVHN